MGWGYYYLVTVMDDYSRFILAWKVQRDMTADSLIEVVQEAVDSTGMTGVPLEDRTKLLSDNGSGYVSRAFREYMGVVGIRHVLAAPYHPQTNGKLERYHRTLKDDCNQVPYEVVEDLEAAIRDFVEFYNYRRYHQALRVVAPADVLEGRLEGNLVLKDGCLRLESMSGTDPLLIGPKRFRLTVDDRGIHISDDSGVSLSVGEELRIGGGEVPLASLQSLAEQPVLNDCPGPSGSSEKSRAFEIWTHNSTQLTCMMYMSYVVSE